MGIVIRGKVPHSTSNLEALFQKDVEALREPGKDVKGSKS